MAHVDQQYETDPAPSRPTGKHPRFIVRRQEPFNGGPDLELLQRSYITPTELFFVRNHGAIPQIDQHTYRLRVSGIVQRALALSLHDLRTQFPRRTLTATLHCAGNRRQELMEVRPIPDEVEWGPEAISTATWEGVLLRDVLDAAGVHGNDLHAAFTGLDQAVRNNQRFAFGGSLPLAKALGDEVLLAYEMNGAALAPIHGYPLRVVAPGYIGARSIKWLASITIQDQPADNYFQRKAYRLFPPEATAETADWESAAMLEDLPVNSVICTPADGAELPAGKARVAGYASAGGGRRIARVAVSGDGGNTWQDAELQQDEAWAWALWQAQIELLPGPRQLIVRAWDSAGNTQPEDPRDIWNFKGYLNNAWHRVNVAVRE